MLSKDANPLRWMKLQQGERDAGYGIGEEDGAKS